MATRRQFILAGAGAAAAAGAAVLLPGFAPGAARAADGAPAEHFPFTLTDAQWRARLTPAQYKILRQEGTEPPYSSPLNDEHRAGTFSCAGCGHPLYSSRTKFESHTGWPSFWAPLDGAVGTSKDTSFGMLREAVHCARCGGHLGHVFDDGPKPTGLRYCMDGLALSFKPEAA